MARKKSPDKMTNFSVRVGEKELSDLQDLARLSRTTLSEMVGGICAELVKANRQRIANFRRQAATPIKLPSFDGASKNPAPIANTDSESVAPMKAALGGDSNG